MDVVSDLCVVLFCSVCIDLRLICMCVCMYDRMCVEILMIIWIVFVFFYHVRCSFNAAACICFCGCTAKFVFNLLYMVFRVRSFRFVVEVVYWCSRCAIILVLSVVA